MCELALVQLQKIQKQKMMQSKGNNKAFQLPRRGQKFNDPTSSQSLDFDEETDFNQLHPNEFSRLSEEQRQEVLNERKKVYYTSISQKKSRKYKELSICEYVKEIHQVLCIDRKGKIMQNMGHRISKSLLPAYYTRHPLYYTLPDIDEDKFSTSLFSYVKSKAVWLLQPEEALYLLDTNAMALFTTSSDTEELVKFELKVDHKVEHFKLRKGHMCISMQDAYCMMLRSNYNLLNISLVYAYLRRLGFIVQRYSKNTNHSSEANAENTEPVVKDIIKSNGKQKQQNQRKNSRKQAKDALTHHNQLIAELSQKGVTDCRGWWTKDPDHSEQYKETLPADMWKIREQAIFNADVEILDSSDSFVLGSQDFFSSNEDPDRPMIESLQLRPGQRIRMKRLYDALSIIQTSASTSETTTDDTLIFDVWKSVTYKGVSDPPSFRVIVQRMDDSVQVPYLFNLWKEHQPVPLYHAIVGDGGAITFMSLRPIEIELLVD